MKKRKSILTSIANRASNFVYHAGCVVDCRYLMLLEMDYYGKISD